MITLLYTKMLKCTFVLCNPQGDIKACGNSQALCKISGKYRGGDLIISVPEYEKRFPNRH